MRFKTDVFYFSHHIIFAFKYLSICVCLCSNKSARTIRGTCFKNSWVQNVANVLLFAHAPLSWLISGVVGVLHCAKKPVTTMLTYPWKCTVLHCNHLGNTWKPLVLMIRHFDYCPSASEGDNQSARSSAPVVSRCFPGGYNVKLYISRGRLAWW